MTNLEHWPINRPVPYARNARKIPEKAIDKVAASIAEFGWRQPLVVDRNGVIIAGHTRLLAAKRLGLESVPVHVAAELTEGQVKAYRLMDNRSHEEADWDMDLVAAELCDLQAFAVDLSLTGFDEAELKELIDAGGESSSAVAEEDEIVEPPARAVSRPGDLWLLGDHRLVCGDSADPRVVRELMNGESACLCFTSPPYGQQRDYTAAVTDWDALMRGVFAQLPMTDGGQVLVNLGLIHRQNEVLPYWEDWVGWMRIQGWRRFGWYVWDQGPGMPGDWAGRLAPSFEFVFHFNKASRKPNKIVPCKYAGQETHLRADGSSTAMRARNGEVGGWTHAGEPTQEHRIPDSVIRVMRHKGAIGQDIDHPAVFPIALPEHALLAYSDRNDVIYEPFSGSGSTILAGQRTGRKVRAVELAPEYVDVALKRFQQHYPAVAVKLAATGEPFSAVAAQRLEETDGILAG